MSSYIESHRAPTTDGHKLGHFPSSTTAYSSLPASVYLFIIFLWKLWHCRPIRARLTRLLDVKLFYGALWLRAHAVAAAALYVVVEFTTAIRVLPFQKRFHFHRRGFSRRKDTSRRDAVAVLLFCSLVQPIVCCKILLDTVLRDRTIYRRGTALRNKM